jgi:hypothetical protein
MELNLKKKLREAKDTIHQDRMEHVQKSSARIKEITERTLKNETNAMQRTFEEELYQLKQKQSLEEKNATQELKIKLNREKDEHLDKETKKCMHVKEERLMQIKKDHEDNVQNLLRDVKQSVEQECRHEVEQLRLGLEEEKKNKILMVRRDLETMMNSKSQTIKDEHARKEQRTLTELNMEMYDKTNVQERELIVLCWLTCCLLIHVAYFYFFSETVTQGQQIGDEEIRFKSQTSNQIECTPVERQRKICHSTQTLQRTNVE